MPRSLYFSGLLRYSWALPATVLGLVLAALALWRGRVALVDGVVEAEGPLVCWALAHLVPLPGGAAAITLGHVVLGRDPSTLALTRAHERVHVRQYELWGPFFLPAYLLSSSIALARRRHAYYDNVFEQEAHRIVG